MKLVIAHRGFSGKYPENTMIALKKAVEAGANGVEVDIRSTKDNKLILFHDFHLLKTSKIRRVKSMTLEQIKKLRIQGHEIITLEEALNYLSKTKMKYFMLDIKASGYEKEIISIIKKTKTFNRVIVFSLNAKILKKIKSFEPKLKVGYSMDNRPDRLRTWKKLHSSIGLFSLHPFHRRPISMKRLVRQAKSKNLKVFTWCMKNTKNNIEYMKKLSYYGVDGFITDYPDEVISSKK